MSDFHGRMMNIPRPAANSPHWSGVGVAWKDGYLIGHRDARYAAAEIAAEADAEILKLRDAVSAYYNEGRDSWGDLRSEIERLTARVAELEAEREDLRTSVVAFCAPWAVRYARDRGLPDGMTAPDARPVEIVAAATLGPAEWGWPSRLVLRLRDHDGSEFEAVVSAEFRHPQIELEPKP